MEFKYEIGFLIPKYGEIISREIVGHNDIRYRVKMNYDDPESEDVQVFTEEVISYYIEQYESKNKNYKLMSIEEIEKYKEDKIREFTENIKSKKKEIVDLEILEGGKCILNRNVIKGEVISYQNKTLKKMNKIEKVEALEDLNINDTLQAGHYTSGKVIICANEDTDGYLVVKKQN